MSTNFYLRLPQTPPGSDGLHIGLSTSHGRFLFQAHARLGLVSADAWARKFAEGVIVSELEEVLTPDEFKSFVDAKQAGATSLRWWEAPGATIHENDTRFIDAQGYSFDRREFC